MTPVVAYRVVHFQDVKIEWQDPFEQTNASRCWPTCRFTAQGILREKYVQVLLGHDKTGFGVSKKAITVHSG